MWSKRQHWGGGAVIKLTFVLILQERSLKMHAIEEHKAQEDQSESDAATGKEGVCRYICMKASLLYLLSYILLYVMLNL